MKNCCYWLVLALLILVISPVSAADMYYDMNNLRGAKHVR